MKEEEKAKDPVIKELQQKIAELELSKTEQQLLNEELKKRVEELDMGHADIDMILTNMKQGLAYLAFNDKIVYLNKPCSDLFSLRYGDVLGKDIYDFHRPEIKGKIEKIINGFKKGKKTFHLIKTLNNRIIDNTFHRVQDDNGNYKGILLTAFDITDRKQTEDDLKESEEKFRTFMESASDLMNIVDKDGKFTYVNEAMVRILGYSKEELMRMYYPQILSKESLERSDKIREELMLKGKLVLEETWIKKDGKETYGEVSLVAIRDSKGKYVGCRTIIRDFTERKKAEKKLKHSMENLRRAVGGIVKVLVLTVEMRDPYTAGHQQRVSNLARTIATDMGLSKEKIEATRVAGTIHDLGKISIPSDILTKPSALKENEFAIIKDHPQVGYDILKEVDLPGSVSQIVLQHHERLDGSGYPLGLTGEDIFIEARILAVADVVEAMAYHRPYRPAFGIDTALQEVSKNKGTLYDPEAVDICLKLFTEKGFRLQL
jgi:PAS domain S-box-containing protein/putative nucleotidyltransferase with HDIG domain